MGYLVIIVCALCLIALLIVLVKTYPWLSTNHEKIKNYVEVVAILAAGFWAIYQFVYIEKIKPEEEPPEISAAATLEVVGKQEHSVAVKVSLATQNIGKASTKVIAAYYNVVGYKIGKLSSADDNAYQKYATDLLKDKLAKRQDALPARYLHLDTLPNMVVNGGNLLQGWTMDPGDNYLRHSIFYVPDTDVDLLIIEYHVDLAKNLDYETKIYRQWRVEPNGALIARFFVKDKGQECQADNPVANCTPLDNQKHASLIKQYGLTQYDAISALSLWQSTTQAKSE